MKGCEKSRMVESMCSSLPIAYAANNYNPKKDMRRPCMLGNYTYLFVLLVFVFISIRFMPVFLKRTFVFFYFGTLCFIADFQFEALNHLELGSKRKSIILRFDALKIIN